MHDGPPGKDSSDRSNPARLALQRDASAPMAGGVCAHIRERRTRLCAAKLGQPPAAASLAERFCGRRHVSLGMENVVGGVCGGRRNRIVGARLARRRARRRNRACGRRRAIGMDSRAARLRSELQPRQRRTAVHTGRGDRHDARTGLRLPRLLSRRLDGRSIQSFRMVSLVERHHCRRPRGRPHTSGAESPEPCAYHRAPLGGRSVAAWRFDLLHQRSCWVSAPKAAGRRSWCLALLLIVVGTIRFGLVVAASASLALSVLAAYCVAFNRGCIQSFRRGRGSRPDLVVQRRTHRPDTHHHGASRGARFGGPR